MSHGYYHLHEMKDHLGEIQAYASQHGLTVQQAIPKFLKPVAAPAPEAGAAAPADFGCVQEAPVDSEKDLAIALERILQGTRAEEKTHTTLYRHGYVAKAENDHWVITPRGKALVERFKIQTNDLGELLGGNVRVVKRGWAGKAPRDPAR